jgi:hypothetical protein
VRLTNTRSEREVAEPSTHVDTPPPTIRGSSFTEKSRWLWVKDKEVMQDEGIARNDKKREHLPVPVTTNS